MENSTYVKDGYQFPDENYTMSMNQLTQNPSGKHTGYIAARRNIIADLDTRFHKIYSDSTKTFTTKAFVKDGGNTIVYHVKVPTEQEYSVQLHYDVIIEVEIPPDTKAIVLYNYPCKVFSNSPAFAYTYAYVYNKLNKIPDFIDDKVSDESKKQQPSARNPVETIGFEKSVYFAIKYLKEKKYGAYSFILKFLKKFDVSYFKKNIKDFEAKLVEVNKIKTSEKLKAKEVKKHTVSKDDKVNQGVKKVSSITKVKTNHSVKTIKKSGITKIIKKK